jgi:hypothetical protein
MPALIAITSLNPDGTFVWPLELSPQAMTVPSRRRATLNPVPDRPPAETATTLLKPDGTLASPDQFLPHAMTVPSSLTARLCCPPAATAVNRVPGLTNGKTIAPQVTTWPLAFVNKTLDLGG